MSRMPVAAGDIREIAGQPVFVPLYKLFLAYGEMFVLAIGPKKFVVVSDNEVAKEMLLTQANSFSKGLLSEILDFVMGTGLIPANGETWKIFVACNSDSGVMGAASRWWHRYECRSP